MEAVCFFETSLSTYKCTKHYNPEDQHGHVNIVYGTNLKVQKRGGLLAA
jgi:hypothetical protein